jgi:hypothetical protein
MMGQPPEEDAPGSLEIPNQGCIWSIGNYGYVNEVMEWSVHERMNKMIKNLYAQKKNQIEDQN